jgi:hypothetical protein
VSVVASKVSNNNALCTLESLPHYVAMCVCARTDTMCGCDVHTTMNQSSRLDTKKEVQKLKMERTENLYGTLIILRVDIGRHAW